ncbi:MAG TPA: DUF4386 domain-containing protein [Thermoanaerobaculia bacterium]|nr:DUF4386 domain-containing protein [Thermoanaerobaculia bacterium]
MTSLKTYARIGGVLFLISMFAGFYGEMYAPSKIVVANDAAATAQNIRASESMFRLGFAAYLVEALCDIGLTWVFYVLLKPVHRQLALLAAFFGIVSTATFAGAELFYLASALVLRDVPYLQAFTAEQRNAIALLSMKAYSLGAGVFMVFYGTAMLIRASLIIRSRYLPAFLGVLLGIGGIGFITRSFLVVLAPAYASNLLLAPMGLAGLAIMTWFLTKGVDERVLP